MQEPSPPPAPVAPPGYALLQQDAPGPASESAELFDWALIGSCASFVLHSIWRHKGLFLLVWIGIIATSIGLMAVMPKTYQVQTMLQAERNQAMPGLGMRAVPLDGDAPTRLAAETVQRYDNVVALIQQTELLKNWPLHRAPILRLKDFIWRHLFKPRTHDEQIEDFVYYLRSRLWVKPGDGTLTIGIEFPDPQLAYRLVDTALQNFLEVRHALDVSSIAETITILESRTDQAHQALEGSLQKLQVLREARGGRTGRRVGKSVAPRAPVPPDQETERLLVAVHSKRRAIADLEEFRRRRITELQTRLQEQRAIYSENHPAVLDIQQSLEAVRQESPQIAALKRELAPLEAEVKKRGIADNASESASQTPVAIEADRLGPIDPFEDEGPEIEYVKGQVRYALTNYNSFLDRLESARLELDSARAAFKYRYTIITPVQRPRGPIRPKPARVVAASLIAGFVLAVFSAALVDLRSSKLLENWQVERQLKLPLIGEFRTI